MLFRRDAARPGADGTRPGTPGGGPGPGRLAGARRAAPRPPTVHPPRAARPPSRQWLDGATHGRRVLRTGGAAAISLRLHLHVGPPRRTSRLSARDHPTLSMASPLRAEIRAGGGAETRSTGPRSAGAWRTPLLRPGAAAVPGVLWASLRVLCSNPTGLWRVGPVDQAHFPGQVVGNLPSTVHLPSVSALLVPMAPRPGVEGPLAVLLKRGRTTNPVCPVERRRGVFPHCGIVVHIVSLDHKSLLQCLWAEPRHVSERYIRNGNSLTVVNRPMEEQMQVTSRPMKALLEVEWNNPPCWRHPP